VKFSVAVVGIVAVVVIVVVVVVVVVVADTYIYSKLRLYLSVSHI
jgi:hypothetical protein